MGEVIFVVDTAGVKPVAGPLVIGPILIDPPMFSPAVANLKVEGVNTFSKEEEVGEVADDVFGETDGL